MISVPSAHQAGNPQDRITGLPRLSAALADVHALTRHGEGAAPLGIITFAVPPTPQLYRLTPEAAQRLRIDLSRQLAAQLRPKDKLYSVSQWEWLAILPELPSSAPLTLATMKLHRAFNRLVETIDGNPFPLRAICGAALWPDDGDSALHLVQSARIARLHADRYGTGAELYRPDMEEVDASQHHLHRALQQALQGDGGLCLHLQPQVDLASGRCVGVEALLRWQLDGGDWVPPHHVLAVVARFGLGKAFNRWLLQQAVQAQIALAEAGIDIVLSLNLSASDLLDPELPDLVAQILSTWELAPGKLLLEITETAMVAETEQVTEVLRRLNGQGIKLSIDDFGTGYSGMSNLRRLPVQEVKIDQSFVRQATRSERNREIVASIVLLAHRLGMLVVAEGVESEEIRRIVAELGCERGQGHFFSPALPLDAFVAWWRERHAR